MTIEQARAAGQLQFHGTGNVFAVMRTPDETYTFGLENTSMPKSREEALARPTVVERWSYTAMGWRELFL